MENDIKDIVFTEKEKTIFNKILFKEIRKYKNLTQKEVAELLGKKTITIQAYENNRLNVTFDTLYLFIKKINIFPEIISDIVISDNFIKTFNIENNTEYSTGDFIFSAELYDYTRSFFNEYENLKGMHPIDFKMKNKLNPENNINFLNAINKDIQEKIYIYIEKILNFNNKSIDKKNIFKLSSEVFDFLEFLMIKNNIYKK